jgi:hypothetical protein
MNNLIFFYGEGCPHCERMEKIVCRLEDEHGIEICRKEVWNDEENLKHMESLDNGSCGGVPFFINIKSGKSICGEVSLNELKLWACEE